MFKNKTFFASMPSVVAVTLTVKLPPRFLALETELIVMLSTGGGGGGVLGVGLGLGVVVVVARVVAVPLGLVAKGAMGGQTIGAGAPWPGKGFNCPTTTGGFGVAAPNVPGVYGPEPFAR